jgi:carbon storage regulator
MLVLSRKVGEKLLIGNNIVVTVLESKGRQIRLGIEAPPSVSVWRGEINDRAPTARGAGERMAHAN